MTLTRRRQLVLVASIMMVAALSSLGWWITSSPGGMRRAAEATLILFTGICALGHSRRMLQLRTEPGFTERAPLVLATTLVALVVTLMTMWR